MSSILLDNFKNAQGVFGAIQILSDSNYIPHSTRKLSHSVNGIQNTINLLAVYKWRIMLNSNSTTYAQNDYYNFYGITDGTIDLSDVSSINLDVVTIVVVSNTSVIIMTLTDSNNNGYVIIYYLLKLHPPSPISTIPFFIIWR